MTIVNLWNLVDFDYRTWCYNVKYGFVLKAKQRRQRIFSASSQQSKIHISNFTTFQHNLPSKLTASVEVQTLFYGNEESVKVITNSCN